MIKRFLSGEQGVQARKALEQRGLELKDVLERLRRRVQYEKQAPVPPKGEPRKPQKKQPRKGGARNLNAGTEF